MPEFDHPSEPLRLTLQDGQERKFLLSMGGLKRLKERFKVKTIAGLMEADLVDAGVPILYEALLQKNGLTEDQFIEIVPADLQALSQIVLRLFGFSFPEPKPRPPDPDLQQSPPQIGTNLNSGPSGLVG